MDCKVVQNYVITPVVLGQGSFGVVYRGYMKNNKNQLLAVKAIPIDKIKNEQSIKRQIEILLKLDSVNVVKFYKPAKTKNHLYFFLEYCQQDLKNYVKSKGGKLSQKETLDILRQICNGFKEVHKQNIIHRDIKPANFLIHKNVIKIADFGFARAVTNLNEAQDLTLLGSPLYMAPQILARQNFSSKCDIWSLGVTIFEILYGQTPYTAKNPTQLLQNIKKLPLKFPQQPIRSDDIKKLLSKMLEKDEAKRISWTQLFEEPLINPKQQVVQKSEDSLVNSMRQNQAYLSRNKVVAKTTVQDSEEVEKSKAEKIQGTDMDFATDLKQQQEKIKQYVKIEEIDEHMRYRRNVSVFLNVQCNQFFSIGGQKLPELIFYMGLYILLKHQIYIHENLLEMLNEAKTPQKFPEAIWPIYLKSSSRGRVIKLVQCDLKHLSSYFKQVKSRVINCLKSNKGPKVQVINIFQKNFIQKEDFSIEHYGIIMDAIISQLEKQNVHEGNFFTKLRITKNPFKYLGQNIDFGLFYEQQNQELGQLRKKFPDI